MTTNKKNKLTLTLQFDMGNDSFARFCKALINGGFESEVRDMGAELLKEAKRRNLPIANTLAKADGEQVANG